MCYKSVSSKDYKIYCINCCLKIINENENLFLKNYLEYNKKEYFNHEKIDKILVNLIMKILFCIIPYFDFLSGEISHMTHNLGKNYDKNLSYSKKLIMIDWKFFKKSYKSSNHITIFFLGNHFRTAHPGYDNYVYLMKLCLKFVMTLMTYFLYFRMNLLKLTKTNYDKGFHWSQIHLGYDSCTLLAATCGKPKIVSEHSIYILYLKISSHKRLEFVFYIPLFYSLFCQALSYWYISQHTF